MTKSIGMDPAIDIMRQRSIREELDYGFVIDCLKQYKNPRKKLSHLLQIGALIRVKKGLYVFGKSFARGPRSIPTLANLIYGPSYISLEWACRHYNLIPEHVTMMTSVTTKRSKAFQTPLGYFTYDHVPLKSFSIGVTLESFTETQNALIAVKEKAVVDLLILRRGFFNSMKHFKETLFEDLRFEEDEIAAFNLEILRSIQSARPHSAVKYLMDYIENE